MQLWYVNQSGRKMRLLLAGPMQHALCWWCFALRSGLRRYYKLLTDWSVIKNRMCAPLCWIPSWSHPETSCHPSRCQLTDVAFAARKPIRGANHLGRRMPMRDILISGKIKMFDLFDSSMIFCTYLTLSGWLLPERLMPWLCFVS